MNNKAEGRQEGIEAKSQNNQTPCQKNKENKPKPLYLKLNNCFMFQIKYRFIDSKLFYDLNLNKFLESIDDGANERERAQLADTYKQVLKQVSIFGFRRSCRRRREDTFRFFS